MRYYIEKDGNICGSYSKYGENDTIYDNHSIWNIVYGISRTYGIKGELMKVLKGILDDEMSTADLLTEMENARECAETNMVIPTSYVSMSRECRGWLISLSNIEMTEELEKGLGKDRTDVLKWLRNEARRTKEAIKERLYPSLPQKVESKPNSEFSDNAGMIVLGIFGFTFIVAVFLTIITACCHKC